MTSGNRLDEKDILNSWKEISQYLDHNSKTCSRWEKKLGLPVHRYDNLSSRSTVFAYKYELDEWLEKRKNNNNSIQVKNPLFKTKGLALYLIIFVISLIVLFSILNIKPLKRSSSNKKEIISIGIQPFQNSSSSEYDEYLAQGITNEISSYLSSSENLRIITLPADQELMGEKIPQNQIKTDFILNGRVQKNKNNINFQYKLINAQNNKAVINNEIQTKLKDIQNIKESISKQIHEKLDIAYNNLIVDPSKTQEKNYEAIDAFLKGKYLLNHIKNTESDPWKLYHKGKFYYGSYTRESNETAIELFNAAINIDEEFFQAYVGLAQCYLNYVNLGWDNNIKWLDKAETLLTKVQSTSTTQGPEYFSSLAKLYLLKYLGFNEETKEMAFNTVRSGLEKYPEDNNLNLISSYCFFLKYGEEGDISILKKALEYGEKSFWQNPLSIDNLFYTELLLLDEQFDKGLEICDIVKKIDGMLMAHFRAGEIYYYSGELEKSGAIFNQVEDPLKLKIGALFYLGMIAAQNKNVKDVQSTIKRLENISMNLLEDELRLSSMYFGIGYEEEGFRHLDKFFSKPRTQRLKYNYIRYIALDKNFSSYIKTIRRKYFE